METLFEELKRYVRWQVDDEDALRALAPLASPEFERIADVFYSRILEHEHARKSLEAGERQIGHLKIALQTWMRLLLDGPWDEAYYELRARIGRMHVRIALPQHYMFGAMDVLRSEFTAVIDSAYASRPLEAQRGRTALGKILDLELAIMLHTYREDLVAQHSRVERLATFGQLVGSIGHELRNPLGVIESSLYILGSHVGGDERGKKHVRRISEQVTMANQIISDLLEMIREQPLARSSADLEALIVGVVAANQRPAGVAIHVHIDALPAIAVDVSKLRQVFVNLLDNAIYAVGEKGQVQIRGEVHEADVVVRVSDSGPGVDPSIRLRLFEPLVTTKAKGIGLGLPLVRRVVERHGGTVRYEQGTDGGAVFVVRLPLEDPHA